MTARKAGYSCDIVTVLIPFNDNGEFSLCFHRSILHLKKRDQRSVVVFQTQMRNQLFALQVPEGVLQLHQLDEQIVFGVESRCRHWRLEVEAQPLLNANTVQLRGAFCQIEEQNKVEDD